jgi:hypothetical protein
VKLFIVECCLGCVLFFLAVALRQPWFIFSGLCFTVAAAARKSRLGL